MRAHPWGAAVRDQASSIGGLAKLVVQSPALKRATLERARLKADAIAIASSVGDEPAVTAKRLRADAGRPLKRPAALG